MQTAILLYDGYTGLDAIGPLEVFRRLPNADITLVSARPGPCASDTPSLEILTRPLGEVTEPDIVLVPGGSYTWRHLGDEKVLDWLRQVHRTSSWTTSVCTGSLLLGAAGILDGLRATSHFYELDSLRAFNATPVAERVVWDGKVVTAAGVSAGIDMALQLLDRIVGAEYAQAVQLGIEYDPAPPHDTGSVAKAPDAICELVTAVMREGYGPPWIERSAETGATP